MTKSESFNWHRTSKICNGIYDFGLLRDKPDVEEEEEKPKLFSIYFSRTVFIVGIIAGVTFMVCLVLADRYQKTVNAPHHYASFIYEKEGDKHYLHRHHRYNLTLDSSENVDVNTYGFRKLQNLSKNVPIDEINQLVPITTVLHSVNVTERSSRAIPGKRNNSPNLDELNKNVSGIRLVDTASRAPLNLAELLKRTEVQRPIEEHAENDDGERLTTAAPQTSTLQFAQLESYKHYYNTKNVQDILKYVNCPTAEECNPHVDNVTDSEEPPSPHVDQFDGVLEDEEPRHDQTQAAATNSYSLNQENDAAVGGFEDSDLLYADSRIPIYLSPFLPPDPHHETFDQFYDFRASSPLEINEMDQVVGSTAETQQAHRFSNRIYQSQPETQDNARLFTDDLEPYLKPPTPPPTGISFTPSYTASIHNELTESSPFSGDTRPEIAIESANDLGVDTKPISLMVEIFPANDYQLPRFEHGQQHETSYLNRQGDANNVASQSLSPAWLPWKLSPAYNPNNQNRMRLFVNLFPQLIPKMSSN